MSGSLNKVIIIGRLGRDPELTYTTSGQAVATMSIATDESWKNQNGEKIERTEWHRVVAWRGQAEFAGNYLGKGRLILVEGKLQTRSWETDAGEKRYVTEIVARSIQALDSKREGIPAPTDEEIPPDQTKNINKSVQEDDEIPF